MAAQVSMTRALLVAQCIALIVSTQYLFQPFLWRHWPLDEILLGGLEVLRDRAVVATCIAIAFVAVRHAPQSRALGRSLAMGLGIVLGAVTGEGLLMLLGAPAAAEDGTAFVGGALRWAAVAAAITTLLSVRARSVRTSNEARRIELERLMGETQLANLKLQALRAQIEPHFLFNTLATVRRLGSTDPALCARLLDHLHTFTRLSLAAQPDKQRWSLGQELDLVRAYLGVVAVRMQGRLSVTIDIAAEVHGFELPPLMLASLVENAVKHGITPSTEGGAIAVSAACRRGEVEIAVADTGVGFRASTGTGIGLSNTRSRLRTLYGGNAGLELRANHPRGVVALLRLPAAASALGV